MDELGEIPRTDPENKALSESFMYLDKIILEKTAAGEMLTASDRLMDREVHVKHAAWKLGDNLNEIWINGQLGVCFSPGKGMQDLAELCARLATNSEVKPPTGIFSTAFYILQGDPGDTREAVLPMTITQLARWHLAWLTDPNVWIDSATIDMEYNAELTVENRKFRIKHLNISVQTNYSGIHGWLLLMDSQMESFIFRGNGILDSNRFLQLPFASKLKKLMIIYESSFDDRTLNLLNAQHLQLASDFVSDIGINKMLHRWNDQNYPIRSTFVIYYQVKAREGVVVKLNVQESNHNENGVSEYLIQMTDPNKRMRLIIRSSSVICTVFAVSNCLAEDVPLPDVPTEAPKGTEDSKNQEK